MNNPWKSGLNPAASVFIDNWPSVAFNIWTIDDSLDGTNSLRDGRIQGVLKIL